MLLSDLILSKRGPLAKVWIAAHQERKLSKQATLGVDVPESVDAILENDSDITLRVSGQLMLGVTRIYGRQVQYLVEDCKDVRERLSRAFRPGVVDLPEEQITADRRAITLAERDIPAFDIFDWSFVPPERSGGHTAPLSATNLRTASREYGAFNFGRPIAPSIYGGSRASSREASVDSHLDSEDFAPIDLGLGLDDFDMFDPNESMEVGREGYERGFSLPRTPQLPRGPDALDMNMNMDVDADFSFEPMDLGLDLPPLDRASSELSTPPPASPEPVDVTPRTAKRIAVFAERKVKRVRLLAPDVELELDDDFTSPDEETMEDPRFIPSSEEAVRLRSLLRDKKSFLPSHKVDGREVIFAGPPGLPDCVAGLFTFNSEVLRRPRVDQDQDQPQDQDVEVGRNRHSSIPTVHDFDPVDMDMSMGMEMGMGMDDINLPAHDHSFDFGPTASLAPSRAESIARAITGDAGQPLSVFERTESSVGFSKTTGMAMGVLRREIEAIEEEVGEAGESAEPETGGRRKPPPLEFSHIARGASKRAAAGFFFELLVLGTRDAVALKQEKGFGPIEVQAKEGLWSSYR